MHVMDRLEAAGLRPETTREQADGIVREALRKKLATVDELTSPFTGQLVTCERSPGNFWIYKDEGEAWVCVYGPDCQEMGRLPFWAVEDEAAVGVATTEGGGGK